MDKLEDQMARVVASREPERIASQQRYDESSSNRLRSILEKKLQTSFIGALSQFETAFGDLWAHRRDESELTEDELYYRQKWNEVRTLILNNGNNQIRAIHNELTQYTITWNRFHLTLKPVGIKEERNAKY